MNAVDLEGLPEEQAKFIKDIVGFLRQKAARNRLRSPGDDEDVSIVFATHDSTVLGSVSREEIYDHV